MLSPELLASTNLAKITSSLHSKWTTEEPYELHTLFKQVQSLQSDAQLEDDTVSQLSDLLLTALSEPLSAEALQATAKLIQISPRFAQKFTLPTAQLEHLHTLLKSDSEFKPDILDLLLAMFRHQA